METFLRDLAKMLDDPKVSEETKDAIRQMLLAQKATDEKLWKDLEAVLKRGQ